MSKSIEQLDLFNWSNKQRLLTDLGGRCGYCLESENWLTIDSVKGRDLAVYELECQTVESYEDGEYAGFCKNTKEYVEYS